MADNTRRIPLWIIGTVIGILVGKIVLVAYIPWEGYNSEDAVFINERLVY